MATQIIPGAAVDAAERSSHCTSIDCNCMEIALRDATPFLLAHAKEQILTPTTIRRAARLLGGDVRVSVVRNALTSICSQIFDGTPPTCLTCGNTPNNHGGDCEEPNFG